MFKYIKHKILISKQLNFNLFLFSNRINKCSCLFINMYCWLFSFIICSTNNNKLFDICWSSNKIFYFSIWKCLWICIIFMWIKIYKYRIRWWLLSHLIFILLFIIFNHVKYLGLSIVLMLILWILLKWHVLMVIINTISTRLHYL